MNPLAILLWLKSSKLGQAVAAVIAILGAVLYIFSAGKRSERRKQKVRNLENHIETRRRADTAADAAREAMGGLDDSELNDRLRKHGAIRE